jgi:hypothetical protein
MREVAILTLLAGCVILAGATHAIAQESLAKRRSSRGIG